MKTHKMTLTVDSNLHAKYKKYCKGSGLVIGKRIEDLMRADLEQRLIKMPKIKL